MKKILLLISFIAFGWQLHAQSHMSCCSKSATGQFMAMASEKDFQAAHLAPLPYQYDEDLGQMITFKTPDGKKGNAFEILSAYNTRKYLFVFHEWWGLNDYMKKEAAHYFKELKDVNVVVVDLYDGKVATTADEAGKYMQEVTDERARAIIQGLLKHVGKNAKIATLGWCFGGGWSLQASLLAGKQDIGCVMYYGMPEKDVEKLKTLNTDVLGLFANKDQWITPEVVKQFGEDMKAAGKQLTVYSFDEDHAFANPSNPHYSKEDGDKAYTYAIKYLKTHFAKYPED